jgi:type IV fimbrial biogenesis protein FimT
MKPLTSSSRAAAVRGFTVIELLATVTIAATLAAVAAPAMRGMVATARLKSHNSSLQESLMLARTEAIKRNARVVVCKSADQATCTDSGDWQQGWIVFVDNDDSATVTAGEAILHKVQPLAGSFILKSSGNVTEYVSYSSTGAPKVRSSQSFQSGVFTLCQPTAGDARQIEILATGRLSMGRDPVTSCTAS